MDVPRSAGDAAAVIQGGHVMSELTRLPGQLLLPLAQPWTSKTTTLGIA